MKLNNSILRQSLSIRSSGALNQILTDAVLGQWTMDPEMHKIQASDSGDKWNVKNLSTSCFQWDDRLTMGELLLMFCRCFLKEINMYPDFKFEVWSFLEEINMYLDFKFEVNAYPDFKFEVWSFLKEINAYPDFNLKLEVSWKKSMRILISSLKF